MEKLTKVIKNTLIIIIILLFGFLFVELFSKLNNLKVFAYEIFGIGSTQIDAFEGADKNYNGGLSRKQIDDQKNDSNCPTHNDVNDTIFIQDYDEVVVFYKQVELEDGRTIYPNILFIKTDDGLKFDGAMNMHAECYAGWFGTGYSFKVEQQFDRVPSYSKNSMMIFDNPADNFCDQVGFSGFITRTVQMFGKREERIKLTQQYIIKNIYPYFLKFYNNQIEIIQDDGTEAGDFNFFYDYLYRSAISYDYGTNENNEKITFGTCAVDVSQLTVFPLPENLQNKYEIPNTNPTKYFGIYNCNVSLTVNYRECEKVSIKDNKYITDGVKDDPIEKRDIKPNSLTSIRFDLCPKESYLNSKIREITKNSPVKISLYKDDKLTKQIVFDETKFINATGSVYSGLEKGKYNYKIESGQLLFDSFSGSFEVNVSSKIKFYYSYQNGKVMAFFSISPISTDVDMSNIDLEKYPVRILLSNNDKTESYQFIFDSIDKINESQNVLLSIDKYSYVILSEKLIFASTSGNVEITPNNRIFIYTFGIDYTRSDLSFDVKISTSTSSNNGTFKLSGTSDTVNLLSKKLGMQNYYVNISIYDEQGTFIKTISHKHNGTGSCVETWNNITLVENQKYIAQMTYTNGTNPLDDSYIEYQSSTISFEYKALTQFIFTYSCTEIQGVSK